MMYNFNKVHVCTLFFKLANHRFDVSVGLPRAAKEYILENFLLDISEYDVIVGYRADESYFAFVQDFISGGIFYRQLNNAMHLGNLGEQVVIKSQKVIYILRRFWMRR